MSVMDALAVHLLCLPGVPSATAKVQCRGIYMMMTLPDRANFRSRILSKCVSIENLMIADNDFFFFVKA